MTTNWSTPVDRVDNVRFVVRGRRWSARKLARNICGLILLTVMMVAAIIGCVTPFVYLLGGFHKTATKNGHCGGLCSLQ